MTVIVSQYAQDPVGLRDYMGIADGDADPDDQGQHREQGEHGNRDKFDLQGADQLIAARE